MNQIETDARREQHPDVEIRRPSRPGLARRLLKGAIAGTVATVPMTVAMVCMRNRMAFWNRTALPPKKITAELTRVTGLRPHLDRDDVNALSAVAHFGFGAAAGAGYSLVAGETERPLAKGIAYGLTVWGGSYLGWLPMLDFNASGTKESTPRNAMMIAAHVVWGATTAALYQKMTADE